MASKRDLKRSINYICSELFAECVANSLYTSKADDADTEALLSSILRIHQTYRCRVSHPEPGMKPKDYFKDLIANFNNQISEVIDQIASRA